MARELKRRGPLRQSLVDLLDGLRARGFRIGVEHYADVVELVQRLAQQNLLPDDDDHEAWKYWLAPLLCATPDDQAEFYRLFDEQVSFATSKDALFFARTKEEAEDEEENTSSLEPSPIPWFRRAVICLGFGLLLGLLGFVFWQPGRKGIVVVQGATTPVAEAVLFSEGSDITRTNDDGRFEVGSRFGWGPRLLHVEKAGFESSDPVDLQSVPNRELVIPLEPNPLVIQGRLENEDGQPLTNASFKLLDQANQEVLGTEINSAEGVFYLQKPLIPGEYIARVQSEGFQSQSFKVGLPTWCFIRLRLKVSVAKVSRPESPLPPIDHQSEAGLLELQQAMVNVSTRLDDVQYAMEQHFHGPDVDLDQRDADRALFKVIDPVLRRFEQDPSLIQPNLQASGQGMASLEVLENRYQRRPLPLPEFATDIFAINQMRDEFLVPLSAFDEWLRQNYRAVQIAVMLFFLVAWFAWRYFRTPPESEILERRIMSGNHDVRNIQVGDDGIDRLLVPNLRRLCQLMRRHRLVLSVIPDAEKTVLGSVLTGGVFTPAYQPLKVAPEYLVLVDRRGFGDHQGRWVTDLMTALRKAGVFVEVFTFDGDPRICFGGSGGALRITLKRLWVTKKNHQLLVFSDGHGLVHSRTGKLHTWTETLFAWQQRAWLTPVPPDEWTFLEHRLRKGGYSVLPATAPALTALFEPRVSNSPKGVTPESWGVYPEILEEGETRWLADDAPTEVDIEELFEQLGYYLDKKGFFWLTACAFYPEIHWELTLYLGRNLVLKPSGDGEESQASINEPLFSEGRLSALCRLPWFRYGRMPDWLRLKLKQTMSDEQKKRVRSVIQNLLKEEGTARGFGLDIAKENESWWKPFLFWQTSKHLKDPLRDRVFLQAMLGQPRPLAVKAPKWIKTLFFKHGEPYFQFRIGWTLVPFLVMGLCGLGLLPERPPPPTSMIPTFAASPTTHPQYLFPYTVSNDARESYVAFRRQLDHDPMVIFKEVGLSITDSPDPEMQYLAWLEQILSIRQRKVVVRSLSSVGAVSDPLAHINLTRVPRPDDDGVFIGDFDIGAGQELKEGETYAVRARVAHTGSLKVFSQGKDGKNSPSEIDLPTCIESSSLGDILSTMYCGDPVRAILALSEDGNSLGFFTIGGIDVQLDVTATNGPISVSGFEPIGADDGQRDGTISFENPGTYRVMLVVFRNGEAVARGRRFVTVLSADGEPPPPEIDPPAAENEETQVVNDDGSRALSNLKTLMENGRPGVLDSLTSFLRNPSYPIASHVAALKLLEKHKELAVAYKEKLVVLWRSDDPSITEAATAVLLKSGLMPKRLESVVMSSQDPVVKNTLANLVIHNNPFFRIYTPSIRSGLAQLLVTPDGQAILVDTGNLDEGRHPIDVFLNDLIKMGVIKHLNKLVITRYHPMHAGAIARILRDVPLAENFAIYDRGPVENPSEPEFYQYYLRAVKSRERIAVSAGEALDLGSGVFLNCIAANNFVVDESKKGQKKKVLKSLGKGWEALHLTVTYGRFNAWLGSFTHGSDLPYTLKPLDDSLDRLIGDLDVAFIDGGLDKATAYPLLASIKPELIFCQNTVGNDLEFLTLKNLKEDLGLRSHLYSVFAINPVEVNKRKFNIIGGERRVGELGHMHSQIVSDGSGFQFFGDVLDPIVFGNPISKLSFPTPMFVIETSEKFVHSSPVSKENSYSGNVALESPFQYPGRLIVKSHVSVDREMLLIGKPLSLTKDELGSTKYPYPNVWTQRYVFEGDGKLIEERFVVENEQGFKYSTFPSRRLSGIAPIEAVRGFDPQGRALARGATVRIKAAIADFRANPVVAFKDHRYLPFRGDDLARLGGIEEFAIDLKSRLHVWDGVIAQNFEGETFLDEVELWASLKEPAGAPFKWPRHQPILSEFYEGSLVEIYGVLEKADGEHLYSLSKNNDRARIDATLASQVIVKRLHDLEHYFVAVTGFVYQRDEELPLLDGYYVKPLNVVRVQIPAEAPSEKLLVSEVFLEKKDGLPVLRWIEIYNSSNNAIVLNGLVVEIEGEEERYPIRGRVSPKSSFLIGDELFNDSLGKSHEKVVFKPVVKKSGDINVRVRSYDGAVYSSVEINMGLILSFDGASWERVSPKNIWKIREKPDPGNIAFNVAYLGTFASEADSKPVFDVEGERIGEDWIPQPGNIVVLKKKVPVYSGFPDASGILMEDENLCPAMGSRLIVAEVRVVGDSTYYISDRSSARLAAARSNRQPIDIYIRFGCQSCIEGK